jgi:tetratricopeptide (TPR) repeat protein
MMKSRNIRFGIGACLWAAMVLTSFTGCEKKPTDAAEYIARGDKYYEKDDYEKAIADYSAAIELEPQNAAAFIARSRAYYQQEDYEKVIADCTAAIDFDPEEPNAFFVRGNAFLETEQLDKAIADYNLVIKLAPDFYGSYHNRGIAYFNKGDYKSAIASYEKALELNPESESVKNALDEAWEERSAKVQPYLDNFEELVNEIVATTKEMKETGNPFLSYGLMMPAMQAATLIDTINGMADEMSPAQKERFQELRKEMADAARQ